MPGDGATVRRSTSPTRSSTRWTAGSRPGWSDRAAIDSPQAGTIAIWCRVREHEIGTPASQAFVADIIPLAIGAALGSIPGATSLDNTLRVIDPEPTDWVLLELVAEGFHRSIGHGSLRIWGQDGRLMATAQQSCIIRTSHHDRR